MPYTDIKIKDFHGLAFLYGKVGESRDAQEVKQNAIQNAKCILNAGRKWRHCLTFGRKLHWETLFLYKTNADTSVAYIYSLNNCDGWSVNTTVVLVTNLFATLHLSDTYFLLLLSNKKKVSQCNYIDPLNPISTKRMISFCNCKMRPSFMNSFLKHVWIECDFCFF